MGILEWGERVLEGCEEGRDSKDHFIRVYKSLYKCLFKIIISVYRVKSVYFFSLFFQYRISMITTIIGYIQITFSHT